MYGVGHVQSAVLHSYQIIFLILGSVTFVVGLLSQVTFDLFKLILGADYKPRIRFWLFPDNPVKCKFLTTDEKVMVVEVKCISWAEAGQPTEVSFTENPCKPTGP